MAGIAFVGREIDGAIDVGGQVGVHLDDAAEFPLYQL
jgi:hypothetical protein